MSCPDNSPTTFVLKLTFTCGTCKGCEDKAKEIVLNIEGVNSIDINTEKRLATISGNVQPHTVIEEFQNTKKKKIKAELVEEEKDQSKVNEKKVQIGLSQNHGQKSLTVSQQLPEQGKATGEAKSLSKVNKQNLKAISTQNHRSTSHRVSPQPPEQGKATGVAKSLSKVNKQNLKTISTQNHRSTSHRVSPQPPDLSIIAIGEPKANTICNGYPEHEHKMELKSHTKLFKCDGCKHNMELKSHTKPFKCDGCREDGFGKRYRCEPCNRELHEVCMFREPNIIHELFKRSTLAFSQKLGNICDACGLKIYGYSYSNKKDELDLHPCCSKLGGKLRIGDIDFVLRKKMKDKCFCCEKKKHSRVKDGEVPGWCYVSNSKQYKIYCHVYCVSEITCEAWKIGLLDRKGEVDDDFMALEKLDLEKLDLALGPSQERSGRIFKIVVALLRIVISTLLGDPAGLAFSVAELIIQ